MFLCSTTSNTLYGHVRVSPLPPRVCSRRHWAVTYTSSGTVVARCVPESGRNEEAIRVGDEIQSLFLVGATEDGQDAIIEYLSDSVIDSNIIRNTQRENDDDDDNEEFMCSFHRFISNASEFKVNAFAWRGVLFHPPKSMHRTSVLHVSDDRCIQRYFVETWSNEVMTIVFDLQKEETLRPTYRSIAVQSQWSLYGLLGESNNPGMIIDAPSSIVGPEQMILSQLDAFSRGDVETAFRFASPENKKIFNNDVAVFDTMIKHNAQYAPLLQHDNAEILKSEQITSKNNMCVVGISSSATGAKHVYIWLTSLNLSPLHWMVDAVHCLNT